MVPFSSRKCFPFSSLRLLSSYWIAGISQPAPPAGDSSGATAAVFAASEGIPTANAPSGAACDVREMALMMAILLKIHLFMLHTPLFWYWMNILHLQYH